ncbi:MAG TPA: EAL domain-containing protein [Noviherbaspirillum sp.]|jgi:diguanylate cyclase (GGDEF)-like protein/PAS domain S-box-containing protein|uniref:EAL domain-containing protein n=1 Tax=Noviherbaspirillum sp. TaxID=1926288 RepID=UPI002DDD1760|nr:EAL domain-containing protein [Noviherbaspirillum sp.]HEV2608680.1 EAL domain-containing protein [Noviherbaspirillum sp.]
MTQVIDDFLEFSESAKSYLVLGNDLSIVDATSSFLAEWSLRRDDITGRSVFDVFRDGTDKNQNKGTRPEPLISLQEVIDHAPGFICVTRGPTHIVELVNRSCYQIVCHRPVIGMSARDMSPEGSDNDLVRLLDQVYATGKPYVGRAHRVKLQPAPGAACIDAYVNFVYRPIFSEDGAVAGILAFGYDVTKEVLVRDELRSSEDRFHLALEAAGDGVWDWNIAGKKFSLSARGRAMLGYNDVEIGDSMENWLAITHPEDQERVKDHAMACVQGRIPFLSCEYRVRCKNGSWKWLLARGAVIHRDGNGWATRMVGTTIDISSEQETLRRANYDSLTSLPNRNLFRDRLEHEMLSSQRTGRPVALMFIDLDRFKEVNDLLGHGAGDSLLRECAKRIRSCVRAVDTVARLGGDEFTVILTDLDGRSHVEFIAQKILNVLARPFDLGHERIHVSGSIGITMHPDDGVHLEDLIRNADQAMYVAKNAGRNQFCFFTRSMQEKARHRISMIAELREALPRNELRVYFQPIVELHTGRISKSEALLRWRHPQKGMLLPSEFIGLAEESGLINDIGNWVFVEAAHWSKRWTEQAGELFQVSINKSPIQFLPQKNAMNWGRHLRSLGIAWNSISVEITENLLFNTTAATAEILLAMRNAGIQVAIDDFGTGYSSMAYLKKFDVDYLKIDQSFVGGSTADTITRTIAETIIVMAHKLGLKVIAEGIETQEQLDWLKQAGCDYGQGFLFSQPLPPEQFERLLAGQEA